MATQTLQASWRGSLDLCLIQSLVTENKDETITAIIIACQLHTRGRGAAPMNSSAFQRIAITNTRLPDMRSEMKHSPDDFKISLANIALFDTFLFLPLIFIHLCDGKYSNPCDPEYEEYNGAREEDP